MSFSVDVMSVNSSLIEAIQVTKVCDIRIFTFFALFASTIFQGLTYVHTIGRWTHWEVTFGTVLSNNEFSENTETNFS